ncbi:DUF2790 domain-containing protein [Pseudomonas sp. ANT_J28]|uniref:DUF2790 domain-containing protein n=1 Tax=Pseudomonas sp. ANT_J28 TaxID=2597352 RepID=UPI0011F1BDF2|nr:DUF2790 domain-containing protein [Pseudomonas sp. ANT_J28]KAA0983544.1 DUF2790 domain-containing protein [Pseudomonas sp. ANT_J28]
MKMLILGFAALLATGSAFAGTQPVEPVIHDKTGFFVNLDIAKDLSSNIISQDCGIVPTQLIYLDHQGRKHVLDYQVQGMGCIGDN